MNSRPIQPTQVPPSVVDRMRRDPTVWLGLAAFAVILLLATVVDTSSRDRIFWIADFAPLALLTLSVVLLALPDSGLENSEKQFWRALAQGFAAWWLATLLQLLAPGQLLTALVIDGLYVAFFTLIVLALHRQPDRATSGRGEASDKHPLRLATLIFIAGLFIYLVVVPSLVGAEEPLSPAAALALYLVLDAYVTLLVLHRWLMARTDRWRRIYALLTAAFLCITLCDALEAFIHRGLALSWGTPLDALWSLPFVILLLTCRLRDLEPSRRPSTPDPPPFGPFASPVVHILALALALPPLHFAYHALGTTDEALETAQELTVLCWLILLGSMAALRHRNLRRALERLGEEHDRMEGILVERRADVRLMVERRQAADQLEASEDNFALAFRHCPEAISVTTLPEGLHLELNDLYARLIGYRREEILGKTTTELGLWAAPWQRRRLLLELERHGRVRQMPLSLRNHAGELRDLLVSAEHLEIDGGQQMLSVAVDVTGEREVAEELRRQTELLDSWQAVVFAVDAELSLLFWSRHTTKLTGFDAEAVRHRPLGLLLPGGRQAQLHRRRRCAHRRPWLDHLELVGIDQRRLDLQAVWLPVLDDLGTPTAWLVVAPEGAPPPHRGHSAPTTEGEHTT